MTSRNRTFHTSIIALVKTLEETLSKDGTLCTVNEESSLGTSCVVDKDFPFTACDPWLVNEDFLSY